MTAGGNFTARHEPSYTLGIDTERVGCFMAREFSIGDATPAASGPRLRINVLGKFSATVGGCRITISGRKSQALLGCLLLSDTHQLPRSRLTGLLWSEKEEQLARGSLRHAIHEIQRGLKTSQGDFFLANHLCANLKADAVDCDLWDVMTCAAQGDVHPLLLAHDRLTDQILDDVEDVDPAFSEWLQAARERIKDRLTDLLTKKLPDEGSVAVPHLCEAAAQGLCRLNPHDERAIRVLMKARANAGDMGSALAIYTRLWRHLEEEYEIEPHELTKNLVARLRLEQPPPAIAVEMATTPNGPRADHGPSQQGHARPSLAVLPFRVGSPNMEAYFGEGIVDNIIHALASLRELFVIARGSTLQYRSSNPDIRAISRELGVRYILHGTIQRSGDKLRIHTELADGRQAEILKTYRYDGAVADLFALQDQIALDTTRHIAPYIVERELRRVLRKPPQNPTAYDLVLQALEPLHQLEYATFSRARTLLYRAIELDPTYSTAHAYAAYWHCYRIGQEWSQDLQADALAAEKLASRAVELESTEGAALAICAHVDSFMRREYSRAISKFERALSANPNSAFAWVFSAATHTFVGDGPTAVAHARQSIRLSPSDAFSYFSHSILAQAHFVEGNYHEALKFAQLSYEQNRRLTSNLRILCASLTELDRPKDAQIVAAELMRVAPSFRVQRWLQRTPFREHIGRQVARSLVGAGAAD